MHRWTLFALPRLQKGLPSTHFFSDACGAFAMVRCHVCATLNNSLQRVTVPNCLFALFCRDVTGPTSTRPCSIAEEPLCQAWALVERTIYRQHPGPWPTYRCSWVETPLGKYRLQHVWNMRDEGRCKVGVRRLGEMVRSRGTKPCIDRRLLCVTGCVGIEKECTESFRRPSERHGGCPRAPRTGRPGLQGR